MTAAIDLPGILGDLIRDDLWARNQVRRILADQLSDTLGTARSYAEVGLVREAARLNATAAYLERLIPQVDDVPPVLSPYDHRPLASQVGYELT